MFFKPPNLFSETLSEISQSVCSYHRAFKELCNTTFTFPEWEYRKWESFLKQQNKIIKTMKNSQKKGDFIHFTA
jgi:hypothetical protein